jgi:hypothetical protein
MTVSEVQRLKELEKENARLKRLLAPAYHPLDVILDARGVGADRLQ